MSAPEYPDAVLEYVQTQGWSASIKNLRDGLYMISGSRKVNSKSERMFAMVICEPESKVTTEHVKYLIKIAREKSADSVTLATKVEATDEAKQIIEQNNIPSLNIKNQQPKREDVEIVHLTITERLKYLLIGIGFFLGGSWLLFTDVGQYSGRFEIFWQIPYFDIILGLFCIGLSLGGIYPFITGRVKKDAYEYL